jgi:hypothetical protein
MKKILMVTACAAAFASAPVYAKEHHHRHHHNADAKVAELMAKLDAMQQRLDQLEKAAAAKEKSATPAASDTGLAVGGGTKKLSLELSGQMNRAIQFAGDGQRTRTKHVDNDTDPSQVRVVARGKLNDDFSVGAKWEVAAKSNNTSLASMGENAAQSADGGNIVENRKAEIMLESKRYGKLSLGRGNLSSYNVTGDTDQSGTNPVALGSNFHDAAGGVYFTTPSGSATVGNGGLGLRVIDLADGMKSLRDNRVRYDTPKFFNAITLSASHMGRENDTYDFAARFDHEIGSVKVRAGAALMQAHLTNGGPKANKDTYQQYLGTASVLFPIGINLQGTIGKRDFSKTGVRSGNIWVAKLGYILKYFKIGQTAFAIDYGQFNDMFPAVKSNGERYKLKGFGAFIVQNYQDISTDLYVGMRRYNVSVGTLTTSLGGNVNGDYRGVTAVLAGGRVVF